MTPPVPRVCLTREEAAASLGISLDSFERHVQPGARIVRAGSERNSTFIGHANIPITLDLYGHLMPGAEEEAAELLDAYLARAAGRHETDQLLPQALPHDAGSPVAIGGRA
jgi:hypothetical protein